MIRYVCAAAGCTDTFTDRRPPGWVWLVTFHEVSTPGLLNFRTDKVIRDAVLCPRHADELEAWLKLI